MFELSPEDKLLQILERYHQDNIELVEKYLSITVDELLELDNDSAYKTVSTALMDRWQKISITA